MTLISSAKITCEEYAEEDLLFLKTPWQELYEDSQCSSIFSTWEWTDIWWKHFHDQLPAGPGCLMIVGVWKDGKLIGVAPFTFPTKLVYGPKRLRPLGDIGSTEALTEETPFLLRCGFEALAADAIQKYLGNPASGSRWDYAFFRKEETLATADYDDQVNGENGHLFAVPMIASLPASWSLYHAARSRSMKTNIAYYPRKMRKHKLNWKFKLYTSQSDVSSAVADLVRLHRVRVESPRGIPHTSHIPDTVQAEFLKEIMTQFAATGHAWIAVIEVDGVTAASQAFLQSKNSVTFYYSGYDTEFYDYSPLFVLATETIKHCIKQGMTSLNFLPDKPEPDGTLLPASDWKARWGALPMGTVSELLIYTPNPRSVFIKSLRTFAQTVQSFVKGSAKKPTDLRSF